MTRAALFASAFLFALGIGLPAIADGPPEILTLKLKADQVQQIAKAIGNGLVYAEALPLLNELQKQVNEQMPKPETPASAPAPAK